ncbi:MAG: hypothetical protein RL518_1836 [Pseudomonadota bacterium]
MDTIAGIDREILESFVDDALEALRTFETASRALETGQTSKILEDLFCVAHNLKGAAMCIGIEPFGDFVHRVEDIIQHMINGAIPQNDRTSHVFLAAHGCMTNWVNALASNPYFVPNVSAILKDLQSLIAPGLAPSGAGALSAQQGQDEEDEVELQALFDVHRRIYEEDMRARDAREREAKSDSGTLAGNPHRVDEVSPRFNPKNGNGAPRAQDILRISAQKLDELVQLIGELSIHQGIVQQCRREAVDPSPASAHALQLSYKLVKEIHTKALELRMQPLSTLMMKLERNALDLARMQGKKVKIIIEGSDVQLDKTVLDKMSDPLVHVIRNAVDHGIESPAQRQSEGKPAEATLKITALQEAGSVSILVSDDGKGMNDEAIFAAAVRKGIVSEDVQLTSEEIRNLIFVQGISTAPRVTEISGRGVGMDIVMRIVKSLRGNIGIESKLGKGTTLTIMLPTSLSIIDALVVGVDDARYAVPMNELTEIIDLSRYPVESAGKGGFIVSHRGEVVPVEALVHYMPTASPRHAPDTLLVVGKENKCPALLVRDADKCVAFAIDRIVAQQQIVVRPLSDQLDGLLGLQGCTILGDGEPGVILSLPELARVYFSSVGGK